MEDFITKKIKTSAGMPGALSLKPKPPIKKIFNRKLITADEYNNLLNKLKECHLLLNAYIKSIGKNNLGQNDQ